MLLPGKHSLYIASWIPRHSLIQIYLSYPPVWSQISLTTSHAHLDSALLHLDVLERFTAFKGILWPQKRMCRLCNVLPARTLMRSSGLQATAGWRQISLITSHAASLALARWHGWRPGLLLYQTASHAHLDSAPLHLDVWLAPNKSKKGSTPSRRFLLFSGCFLFYPCMACSLAKVSF